MIELYCTRRTRKQARNLSFEPLEARSLLAAVVGSQVLNDFTITGNVGEKPESKLWQHAGRWWGVFSDSVGTHVWRLDGQTWTKTFPISDKTGAYVDAKADGNLTHVLVRNGLNSQLYSLQYVPGSEPTYSFWSLRPTPASVPLSAKAEAATIDLDSKGRMWVGYDDKSSIKVRYSDSPYSTWSNPIIVAKGIKGDDLGALAAMPNGTIGILWSNHNTGQFGFRTHVDGTDPNQWTADEVPASQTALKLGPGFVNDHINLAVGSDSTLYAAIKTGYRGAGLPVLGVLVRRPNGMWDDFHAVNVPRASRPIIQLNEAARALILSYDSGSKWVYQECHATTIACGSAKVLLETGVNATSTKQNVTSDVVILTSDKLDAGAVSGVQLRFGGPNSAPPVTGPPVTGPPVTGVTKSFQDGVFPSAAYLGTRDTKLRASNPTTLYGKDKRLEVFQQPVFTSLFQWDLSQVPRGATVLNASFTLNAETTSKNSYGVYELLGNWEETEANFLQASRNVTWSTPGAVGIGKDRGATVLGTFASPKKGVVTVELNAAGIAVVQKWISDPSSNHGFVLQDVSNPQLRNWVVTAREGVNPQARPKFTVNYAPSGNSAAAVQAQAQGSRTLQNAANRMDVNADTFVTPLDALVVINALKIGSTESEGQDDRPAAFLDVNGDGELTPLDALSVINYLNGSQAAGGEGEGAPHDLLLVAPRFLELPSGMVDLLARRSGSSRVLDTLTTDAALPLVVEPDDSPCDLLLELDAIRTDQDVTADSLLDSLE